VAVLAEDAGATAVANDSATMGPLVESVCDGALVLNGSCDCCSDLDTNFVGSSDDSASQNVAAWSDDSVQWYSGVSARHACGVV